LFSRLERRYLRKLADLVEEKEFAAGDTICQQGEPGRCYFIVEKGEVRVTRIDSEGQVVLLGQLGTGDTLGEASLVLGDAWDETAEAVQPTLLLSINKEKFDRLLKLEPEIKRALQMQPEVAKRWRYPRFPWLLEGELPIKVLYKHPAILMTNLLIPGSFALLLLSASVLAGHLWGQTILVLGLVPTLIPIALCLYIYIDWHNDVYVLTNRRVVQRERLGLLRSHLSDARLEDVQTVQQIQAGPAAHFWDFGDVIIDTAGEARADVIFRSIPHPDEVRTAIFEQRERVQAIARAQERTAIRGLMQRHFLQKEKEPTPAATEQAERQGCLPTLLAFLRSVLPSSWHREGSTVTWRKHWVALVRATGLPSFTFALTTAVVVWVALRQKNLLSPTIILLYALAALVLAIWFLWQYDDWQNDLYRVTATRIIHIEQLPMFLLERRQEAPLAEVTNVQTQQSFFGTLLNYGDVTVDTVSPAGTFHFRMVSRPREVRREIRTHQQDDEQRRRQEAIQRHRAEMLDWFSAYDEIRRTAPPPSQEREEEAQ